MKNKISFFILLFFAGVTLLFFIFNRQMEKESNRHDQEKSKMEENIIKMNEELNKKYANSTIQNLIYEDSDTKS